MTTTPEEEKKVTKKEPKTRATKSKDSNLPDLDYKTLLLEDVKYKTTFTKKFAERKPYAPVDPLKIVSYIPGTIKKIYTKAGKKVKEGDPILDFEAMKMVNTIFAEQNCVISEIHVKVGERVPKNALLITLK